MPHRDKCQYWSQFVDATLRDKCQYWSQYVDSDNITVRSKEKTPKLPLPLTIVVLLIDINE